MWQHYVVFTLNQPTNHNKLFPKAVLWLDEAYLAVIYINILSTLQNILLTINIMAVQIHKYIKTRLMFIDKDHQKMASLYVDGLYSYHCYWYMYIGNISRIIYY